MMDENINIVLWRFFFPPRPLDTTQEGNF